MNSSRGSVFLLTQVVTGTYKVFPVNILYCKIKNKFIYHTNINMKIKIKDFMLIFYFATLVTWVISAIFMTNCIIAHMLTY